MKTHLTHQDIINLAIACNFKIQDHMKTVKPSGSIMVYGIPRGGVAALYSVISSTVMGACGCLREIIPANIPEDADCFIDDIIDSGETMQRYCDQYPEKPFFALIDKTAGEFVDQWVVFPWECEEKSEDDSIVGTLINRVKENGGSFFANDNISEFIKPGEMELLQKEVETRVDHLLRGLVIDVENDHNTKGTAGRVAKMYLQEVFKGRYLPAPKITDFPNIKKLDEIYTIGPITIRSACSHHFVPIVGRCWIGIIPSDRVIGISKFNRIVDWIASRPQIQEEFAMQVADFIEETIHPKGLAVVIEATHLCMTWRGVKESETQMHNSIMRGIFRNKPEARTEFLSLIK